MKGKTTCFKDYRMIQCPVEACALSIESQYDIGEKLSEAMRLGQLSDLKMTVSAVNNCQEYSFRNANETTTYTLSQGDWLVQTPGGKLSVMSDAAFAEKYYTPDVDVHVAENNRRDVRDAMLRYINTNFPELYLGNTPSACLSPFVVHTPASVEGDDKVDVSVSEKHTLVAPKNIGTDQGSMLANAVVTVKFNKPIKATRYLIAMEGDSYNAPKHWEVHAYNSVKSTDKVLSTVDGSAVKSGYYNFEPQNFWADKFVFTFKEFEYSDQNVNKFLITLVSGGEPIETPVPQPFDELTEEVLAKAAEKLIGWYDLAGNKFTVDFSTASIVSAAGLSEILPVLMKASFIKEDTTIAFNFTNNIQTPDTDLPNSFVISELERLVREIRSLPTGISGRITELNFAGVTEKSPSAIATSVTHNTMNHWNTFVTNIISNTAIAQPSQIKR